MTKVHPVLFLLIATAAVVSSDCQIPYNQINNPQGCAFNVHCRETITHVQLPPRCQGSTNYLVTIDLHFTEAIDRFDDDHENTELLSSVTSLKISGKWATTNLTLLQYTPRLKNLILVGNEIENITGRPLFHLEHLDTIDLSGNVLTDIDGIFQFENGISEVKTLFLAYNSIIDIPGTALSELSSLVELDLSHNLISDLNEMSFNNLTVLEILRLNNNKIKDLNGALDKLYFLKQLYLSDNLIQNIDVPSLKIYHALETFDISRNQLKSLLPAIITRHWNHFGNGYTVIKISLSGNYINYLPNATVSQELMERYTEHSNTFTSINGVFTELDLSLNKISHIEYDAFHSVVKLSVLDLSHNKLSSFVVNPIDLQHVKHLNLSKNFMQELDFNTIYPMMQLHMLDLSYNNLYSLQERIFMNKPFLKYVNMTFNEFEVLKNAEICYSEQGVLDLSNNGLQTLNIMTHSGLGLKELILKENKIVNTSLINLHYHNQLKGLDMSNNEIQLLDIDSMRFPRSLTFLNLAYNSIEKIAPGSFYRTDLLTVLRLDHNEIKTVEYGAFQGLTALKYLDLSYNNIGFLDSKTLMDLKSLSELWLRFNGLNYLDYKGWLSHQFVLNVYLEGNSFSCDWLGTAIRDFNNGYSKMKPTSQRGMALLGEEVGPSIDGIACVKNEVGSILEAPKIVMADERLLVLVKKILQELQAQNSFIHYAASELKNRPTESCQ